MVATDPLGLTASDDFNITLGAGTDTTPPTVAITSNQASLSTGQTATITFTLSEASNDFTSSSITVSGGILGALTHVGVNAQGQDVYTAIFTPATNSTTNGVIHVDNAKFHDLANNANADGADANNTVTLTVDTTPTTPAIVANNDTATVGEAGGTLNGTTGSALASTTAGYTSSLNVLSNDTGSGTTKTVTGIKLASASSDTTVSSGTTSSNGATITGQYGDLVMGADGSYTYTVRNSDATVQALKGSTNTLSEVFTYTATSGSVTDTANLTITITGANDAPVGVNDTATAVEKGGTANASSGIDPTGNVLTNDTDVDSGDTKTVSAITGGTVGSALAGQYGSLTLNADGSYSYVVDNANASVQALRTSANTLHDTFTYTVRDAAGLTSTATLDVTVQGANDAPTTIGTLSNTTGTVGTAITDYVIPTTGLFADVDTVTGETSTLSATLANGQALSTIGLAWDATNHKVTGTPTAAGTYTIVVTDTDAGGLIAQTTFDIVIGASQDTTPPTVVVARSGAGTMTAPEIITFAFSEAVTSSSFVLGSINVTGGSLSNLQPVTSTGSGSAYTMYTATFTPTASSMGSFSIGVEAHKFADVAGNQNLDTYNSADGVSNHVVETNNQVSGNFDTSAPDTTAPTLIITDGQPAIAANSEDVVFTFTFSEPVSGFTASDVTVANGPRKPVPSRPRARPPSSTAWLTTAPTK